MKAPTSKHPTSTKELFLFHAFFGDGIISVSSEKYP